MEYNMGLQENYSLKALQRLIELSYDLVRNAYKEVFQKQKGTLLKLTTNFCDLLDVSLNDEVLTFFRNKF